METLMSNIRKQWEALRFNLELTLKALAEELPSYYNGFRFKVIIGEERQSQTSVNVVEGIEVLDGHKWVSMEGIFELDRLLDFITHQNELLTEGDYEYLKNISKDEV